MYTAISLNCELISSNQLPEHPCLFLTQLSPLFENWLLSSQLAVSSSSTMHLLFKKSVKMWAKIVEDKSTAVLDYNEKF